MESNALNNRKLKIFKVIDERGLFYSNNINLLPSKPKLSFRYLKQGIQEFYRKYALAPADKAGPRVKLASCKSTLILPNSPHRRWFTLLTVLRRWSRY